MKVTVSGDLKKFLFPSVTFTLALSFFKLRFLKIVSKREERLSTKVAMELDWKNLDRAGNRTRVPPFSMSF